MPHQTTPHDPARPNIAGFSLPLVNSGLGRTLTTGRGVSVYYDQQPPNTWPEHAHPHVQILLAIDPVDAVVSWKHHGEQERRGVTGQFVWLLPSNAPHALDWHGTAGMVVLYVEPSFVQEVCEADLTEALVADFSTLARFDLLVWHLTGEFRGLCLRRTSATPAIIESAGTLLATKVLHYVRQLATGSKRSMSAERLREVMDYIDAHLRETISRATLARIARMSVRRFGDHFKVRTGLSPCDYIMQRRTARALELLDEGTMKKAVIASELGFSDQSHMMRRIRFFRHAEERAAARAIQSSGEHQG